MDKGAELATDGLQCLDRSDGRNFVSPQSPLPLGLGHFAWWQQDKGRLQSNPYPSWQMILDDHKRYSDKQGEIQGLMESL